MTIHIGDFWVGWAIGVLTIPVIVLVAYLIDKRKTERGD